MKYYLLTDTKFTKVKFESQLVVSIDAAVEQLEIENISNTEDLIPVWSFRGVVIPADMSNPRDTPKKGVLVRLDSEAGKKVSQAIAAREATQALKKASQPS